MGSLRKSDWLEGATVSDSDADRDKFWQLAPRYNALGRLLPREEDLDVADGEAVAEVRIVLAEMDKTKAEMDMLLTANTSIAD